MWGEALWARQVMAALVARTVWPADGGRAEARIMDLLDEAIVENGWATLMSTAISERVVPVLARAALEGIVPVSPEQRERIDDLWADRMRHCLRLEARLLWLAGEMANRGVELRVLKGPAAAHLDHHRPADRQFGDVDVLVRGDEMAVLAAVLVDDGFVRRYPEPYRGFDRRFTKSVSFRADVEIDVHRTIAEGPLGHRIPVDDLWLEPRGFAVAGSGLLAMGDEARFVHACLHAHLGPPPMRLSTMSDIAGRLAAGALDPTSVWDVADRWRIRPVVEGAVVGVLAEVGRPSGLDPRWLDQRGCGIVDSFLLASHRQVRTASAVRAALSTATLPAGRLAYLRALVFPQRSYSRRQGGVVARLGRLGRQSRSSLAGGERR